MFEEIKNIIVYWTKNNAEIDEITPETEFLNMGGCFEICDIIEEIQETYDVVFTVGDFVKCIERKLENSEIEVNDVAAN